MNISTNLFGISKNSSIFSWFIGRKPRIINTAKIIYPGIQVRYDSKKDYPKFHNDVCVPSFDAYRKNKYVNTATTSFGLGDEKPGVTYVMGAFGIIVGAYAAKTVILDFVFYMAAAADVLALAQVEIDISKIEPGGTASFKWRGKPLFIKNRTKSERDIEAATAMSSLRDPQTEADRTVDPNWLVVIGVCTHLGCVPIPNSGDWPGGFYCPCHGSHYDNMGRARKGPAPLNLEVPIHKFISDSLILVG